MEQEQRVLSKEDIKQLENIAVEKSEHGDKPYRKKYVQGFDLVTCHDCGKFQNLILITDERKNSFKRSSHKKNRNRVALLDSKGNKVYLDRECIQKRIKKSKETK